ncbi:universal stress protein [Pelatocladus sp. BLCC-F211]|uniref:universal stress protein n=1 Tax=Pelatocladus sp. BLCC-F211 TaxID=3342752 RepID=UPI0035B7F3F0
MLVRLQDAINRDDLIEQMLLYCNSITSFSEQAESTKSINFIVGYNSSPNSHTALDISLLMAHQTRLATNSHVLVQAVYVLEEYQTNDFFDILPTQDFQTSESFGHFPTYCPISLPSKNVQTPVLTQINKFAQAERILWQARCLAEEWQSYFKAHLRFGCVADELKKVVASEAATILFLGCKSAKHPIVQKLAYNFPCPVLGIPSCIDGE